MEGGEFGIPHFHYIKDTNKICIPSTIIEMFDEYQAGIYIAIK